MGAFSKIKAYSFAILLSKPFSEWDAFKLGLINEKGDILKRPSSSAERDSLDSFENLIRKVKRLLMKYIPDNRFFTFLISAYLLKSESNYSSYFTTNEIKLIDELRDNLSDNEGEILYNLVKVYNNIHCS
jgi:hypothetical protein